MANLRIIKDLAEKKNIPLARLAEETGITSQALSKLMRINSTKIDTLEKIAQILKVSITVFFEEDQVVEMSGLAGSEDNETEVVSGLDCLALLKKKDEQIDRLLSIIEKMQEQ